MNNGNRYDNRERIGRRLRAVRTGLGWSVEQVARMADIKAVTLEKIEAGVFGASVDVLEAICDVLGVRVDIVEKSN